MKFTILDTVSRVSKAGKPYTQAACKAMTKNGTPWLFIATVPDDLAGLVCEDVDRNVVFGNGGSAFVLPY